MVSSETTCPLSTEICAVVKAMGPGGLALLLLFEPHPCNSMSPPD